MIAVRYQFITPLPPLTLRGQFWKAETNSAITKLTYVLTADS